ncbi:MAG: transcriptional repressor [Rhizobium sp.]|jgi:Fur family peroxide stress response transcriptional regulator|nr:transcriptional repressor [Rhizobium sp.]
MERLDIRNKLIEKKLKITPQRLAIYGAIVKLNNHPTADDIAAFIKQDHPNIATGTVYKVLESLVENGLIKKVKTEKDVMRYDAILENHHHLYDAGSDRIADYYNNEINELLSEYFRKNEIPDFEIGDIKLQIIGKFLNKPK